MDFELNDDQRMLAETVDSFVQKSSPVSRFRKLRDDEIGWDPAVWREMGELGWLSVPFPESIGGFGGRFFDVALLLERFGRTLVPEPYVPSVVLAGAAIARGGSEAQARALLEPLIAGEVSMAFAHGEGDGRGPVETTATRDGDGWKLDGRKTFVRNGHRAEHIVVTARTPDGLGLFVVDRDGPGVTATPVQTMDAHRAATVTLEGAAVGDDRRLGDPGSAAQTVVRRVQDYGIAAACAEGNGIAKEVLRMTVEYLHTRKQFDVPIGSFQVLQHYAVDVFVESQLLESIAIAAAVHADDDDDDVRARTLSAAKVTLTRSGRWIVQHAVQMFGGIGVTDEHDVGLYFKRMHALCASGGGAREHLRRFVGLDGFRPADAVQP